MTMIDLGEVTHQDAGAGIPLNYRRILRTVLAVLSVMGVLVLAGSSRGAPPGLRPLWSTDFRPDDMMALDATTAYLSRLGGDGRPGTAAYDLATGRKRWSVPTGDGGADFAARPAGDLVLLPIDPVLVTHEDPDGNKYNYETVRATVAVSAATGEERWRVGGDARPSVPTGTAIVADHDAQNHVVGLRAVKLSDGSELWRRALPPLAGWTPLPGFDHPDAVATVALDGTAATYGYADGRLRRAGRLPVGADATTTMVVPAGPNLAVVRSGPTMDLLTTVYSAQTLKPLWDSTFVTTCGALVCSSGHEGISGQDPGTGRVVWAVPDAFDAYPLTDDRVLAGANRDNTESQLIDSSTGKRLGGPITGVAASGPPLPDELLFTRPGTDPAGQLVVARVDLATGKQTPVGRFGPSGEPAICYASPGYLACSLYDGLHVMAVG
jgi:outer membrane protein assembly factor BamB